MTWWRMLGNKIATKVNLLKRGVAVRNGLGSFCREKKEEYFHLFFDCRISWFMWYLCYAWLGITTIVHFHAYSHLLQFRLCNALESVNIVLDNIWIAMVSEIWHHINKIVFNERILDFSEIFSLAQLKV